MTTKKIVIELEGDGDMVDAGLDSFARAYGFTDPVEGVENKAAIEVAQDALKRYFRETVSSYNSQAAAQAAMKTAREQTDSALDSIKLKIEVV